VQQLLRMMLSGAFGGFVFWLLAAYAQTTVFVGFPVSGQIGASVVLGAAAAAVGVYILTASDVTQVKTLVFAMLCGIAWQPVLQAGIATVQSISNKDKANTVSNVTADINQATASNNATQAKTAINSATPAVAAALNALTDARNPIQRAALTDQTSQAITAIGTSSKLSPQTAVNSLKQVSDEALAARQPALATQAAGSLATISKQASDPVVRASATQALSELATKAQASGLPSAGVLSAVARTHLSGEAPAPSPT
jgi:hypothetical protein